MEGCVFSVSIHGSHDFAYGIRRHDTREARSLSDADSSGGFPDTGCTCDDEQTRWPSGHGLRRALGCDAIAVRSAGRAASVESTDASRRDAQRVYRCTEYLVWLYVG